MCPFSLAVASILYIWMWCTHRVLFGNNSFLLRWVLLHKKRTDFEKQRLCDNRLLLCVVLRELIVLTVAVIEECFPVLACCFCCCYGYEPRRRPKVTSISRCFSAWFNRLVALYTQLSCQRCPLCPLRRNFFPLIVCGFVPHPKSWRLEGLLLSMRVWKDARPTVGRGIICSEGNNPEGSKMAFLVWLIWIYRIVLP